MFAINALSGFGSGGSAFALDNSGDFESSESDSLYRTWSGSPTDNKKQIVSCWVKPESEGTFRNIFMSTGGDPGNGVGLYNDNSIQWQSNTTSGGVGFNLVTTSTSLIGTGTWHHILCYFDTTQGTESNRAALYVDGTKITSLSP